MAQGRAGREGGAAETNRLQKPFNLYRGCSAQQPLSLHKLWVVNRNPHVKHKSPKINKINRNSKNKMRKIYGIVSGLQAARVSIKINQRNL